MLSAIEPVLFTGEQDALKQLRVGIDGVIFQYGHHKSTFLPQVSRDFADAGEFMAHLKYKAGLPPDFWEQLQQGMEEADQMEDPPFITGALMLVLR